MNVIFLTMGRMDITQRGLYNDLMRKFRDCGHKVYIVTPCERRENKPTSLSETEGVCTLRVRTLNVQKTNIVEKGIGQVSIEYLYKRAIKKYLGDVTFDLILYSTPPITFPKVIEYLKKKNPAAKTYLMLKDIFPQNAVDLGMLVDRLTVKGERLKGVVNLGKYQLYKMFRRKEKRLYALSDYIGCMSPANVRYVTEHNPEVNPEKVEVCPNSIELGKELSAEEERARDYVERDYMCSKYNIPKELPLFIYGGNLGRPQGIDYLIKCLDAIKERKDCYFIVVGNGTEYEKLAAWYHENRNCNVRLMERLPKDDYDMLVRACDVGLIFLDHRFTIPNYPSRLLSYLASKKPVICATDNHTDIGKIAEENGYGYWCESVKPEDFTTLVDKMLAADRKEMGEKGYEFLKKNYSVENTYGAIMRHF